MTRGVHGFGGHDITCQQAVGLLTDYLEGMLGPDDRARLEAHLAECASCAEYLEQIRITVSVAGQRVGADLDAATRDDLVDLYRRWRSDPDG